MPLQLAKEGTLTEIVGSKEVASIEDMIRFMINLYQSTLLPREEWLTKQETQFFIAAVIIANKGIKYTSREAKNIFRDVFNLRRQSDVRGYLKRIEEKGGWLRSNKEEKTIQLHHFFRMEDLSDVDLNLEMKLTYDG